jgi:ABC-type amino acid transport substrate-binding protein
MSTYVNPSNTDQHTPSADVRENSGSAKRAHNLKATLSISPVIEWFINSSTVQSYGKLILVCMFATTIIVAGLPPIVGLYHRITALEYQRAQVREEFQSQQSERDEMMDDLTRIVGSPVPGWPPPSAHLSAPFVELRWKAQSAVKPTDYLVEIDQILPDGRENSNTAYATDPDEGVHHPYGIQPGRYIWRVAERKETGQTRDDASNIETNSTDAWSGYSTFVLSAPGSEAELSIAINHAQRSVFMSRSSRGKPCGYDADLMMWVAHQLPKVPRFTEYPTVPAMIAAVKTGEADLAVGSITRTRAREREGIAFTIGYIRSPPVIACGNGAGNCPRDVKTLFSDLDGEEVGVIKDTTNDDLAKELRLRLNFVRKPLTSVDSLINSLRDGQLRYVIVDKPFIQPYCDSLAFRCYSVPPEKAPVYRGEVGRKQGEEYAFAVDNASLRSHIDRILQSSDGQKYLKNLADKHLTSRAEQNVADGNCSAPPEP